MAAMPSLPSVLTRPFTPANASPAPLMDPGPAASWRGSPVGAAAGHMAWKSLTRWSWRGCRFMPAWLQGAIILDVLAPGVVEPDPLVRSAAGLAVVALPARGTASAFSAACRTA